MLASDPVVIVLESDRGRIGALSRVDCVALRSLAAVLLASDSVVFAIALDLPQLVDEAISAVPHKLAEAGFVAPLDCSGRCVYPAPW